MKKKLLFLMFLVMATLPLFAAEAEKQLPPTFADVSYGPHEETCWNFWKAEGSGPRPLLVHIHGGGWVTGDKKNQKLANLQWWLENGVSYAAINYRLTPDNPLPAPVHDAARAIQFLRTKSAEWSIDSKHIAVMGDSAGACTSMWLLLHDDLANPTATDPVLKNRHESAPPPQMWDKYPSIPRSLSPG